MNRASDNHDGVASELAEVARLLEGESSPGETWQRIVLLAVQQLDHCEFAAISLVRPNNRVDTPAASDPITLKVDAIQYETGQGPCLDAIREAEVFTTGDLGSEVRWPDFANRAVAETGIRSMLSFRLFVQEDVLGALNLYSRQVDAFDDHDRVIGSLFAAHAALAMSSAEHRQHGEQMEAALDSSRVIGMAIGVLMVQSQVSRLRAFEILSAASQRENVKLRDLAETIVTGIESRQAKPAPPGLPI